MLNGGSAQTLGKFNTLSAGYYTVTVVDANKCEREITNINVAATGFEVAVDIQPDNACLEGTGVATINIASGSEPFLYKLGNGPFVSDNVFTSLQQGKHIITVKDNNNCTVQLNITVPHGFSGTSWTSEILPIITSNCSLAKCHDGKYQPDLRIYANASFYSYYMKKYTQDGTMPFDGEITYDQINLIACWVDDGALEN